MRFNLRPIEIPFMVGSLLVLTSTVASPAAAATPEAVVREAWQAQRDAGGGRNDDPAVAAAIERAWRLGRDASIAERDRSQAAHAALHILLDSRGPDALVTRLSTLTADDHAWPFAFHELLRAEAWPALERFAAKLVAESTRDEHKQEALYSSLGTAHRRRGDATASRAALERLIAAFPESRHAGMAKGDIHELESVVVGRPAPPFSARDLDGDPVSSKGLAGRVVLVDFWATY